MLLGQAVYDASYLLHPVPLRRAFVRVVPRVGRGGLAITERMGVGACPLHPVERQVAADGEAKRLDGVDVLPVVAPVPDLHERVLHYVLGLLAVEGYPQSKAVEHVF